MVIFQRHTVGGLVQQIKPTHNLVEISLSMKFTEREMLPLGAEPCGCEQCDWPKTKVTH